MKDDFDWMAADAGTEKRRHAGEVNFDHLQTREIDDERPNNSVSSPLILLAVVVCVVVPCVIYIIQSYVKRL